MNTVAPEPRPVFFRSQPFEGLSGVVKDLKLQPAKHAEALDIVSGSDPFTDVDNRTSKLHAELSAVLNDEEYGDFVAAAARMLTGLRTGK